MEVLNGWKTYIGIFLAIAPELFNLITTGLASGQTWIVMLGGVIAILGRYFTKANTPA
jgi:hypothetical protein